MYAHIFPVPAVECQLRYLYGMVLWGMRSFLPLLFSAVTVAGVEPQWELGLGGAVGTFPSYRGAASQHTYAVPFPFVVYRGDWITLDREGLRGELFESERWRLEMSADAMVPVDSEQGLRSGMVDLAPVLELGPSLEYLLQREGTHEWWLRLPLRSALAIDFPSVSEQGWLFQPNLALTAHNGSWEIGASLGPLYATQPYHEYYYGVSPGDATATRDVYRAEAGYSGMRLTIGASRYFGNLWLGAFLRYDDLHGAVFIDSPLVERSEAWMGGVALAWIFHRSTNGVE